MWRHASAQHRRCIPANSACSGHSQGLARRAAQRLATCCAIGILCRFCRRKGWGFATSEAAMWDYSLHHVKSRPAKVGDKLRTVNFNTGTRGFAAPEATTAVCVLPGTELAFSEE